MRASWATCLWRAFHLVQTSGDSSGKHIDHRGARCVLLGGVRGDQRGRAAASADAGNGPLHGQSPCRHADGRQHVAGHGTDRGGRAARLFRGAAEGAKPAQRRCGDGLRGTRQHPAWPLARRDLAGADVAALGAAADAGAAAGATEAGLAAAGFAAFAGTVINATATTDASLIILSITTTH